MLGFVIPGIPTNVNFVLTLVVLEGPHQMITCQGIFSLRDVDPFLAQDVVFNLTSNITVRIRDTFVFKMKA